MILKKSLTLSAIVLVILTSITNADEIEAMTFAWLAYKRVHKEKVNLKDVTGARENTILGAIYA
jgi:1,6-anhydro-N-acetylmuramate kinase